MTEVKDPGFPAAHRFRTPDDLERSAPAVARVLVIGSCFSEGVAHYVHRAFPGATYDHILYNFLGEVPDEPPHPIDQYAFQLIMLPIRTVMPETMFFGLKYNDIAGYDDAFTRSCDMLDQLLTGALKYNLDRGLTTFVGNFLTPQQDLNGRLLPHRDVRNPVRYVRALNERLEDMISARHNVYLLDLDEISATFGRRFIQDDALSSISHGAFLSDWDFEHDRNRLHPPSPPSSVYDLRLEEFILALWFELAAMYRTLRQHDSVKLIICDLDDTLWRGVIAEEGTDRPEMIEGWPLGLIEALTVVKRRGILLAIVSRNSEETIRSLWPNAVGSRLPLTSFAVIKINWRPKAENVAEILRETNLLAGNVLFIDDNPAERESVTKAFPDIRVLGENLYHIRRVLLWAPELQVAGISMESGARTEMVRAQIERENIRAIMPREDFLNSLNIRVLEIKVDSVAHPRFARVLELVNKSNQFNTTGTRWTSEQLGEQLKAGLDIRAFEVVDRYTDYGLVCVVMVGGDTVSQFVMSCRVIGLDVELAIVSHVARGVIETHGVVFGMLAQNSLNFVSHNLFSRSGFVEDGTRWAAGREQVISPPHHIRLETAP